MESYGDSSTQCGVLLCGWLWKEAGKMNARGTWEFKRRWFELSNEAHGRQLLYYKDAAKTMLKGSIQLGARNEYTVAAPKTVRN